MKEIWLNDVNIPGVQNGDCPHGFDGDNVGIGCEGSRTGNGRGCDPSYPDDCIPPLPPDLNCGDSGVPNNVKVVYNYCQM